MLFFSPDYFVSSLRSCAVKILVNWGSAKKITPSVRYHMRAAKSGDNSLKKQMLLLQKIKKNLNNKTTKGTL